MSLSALMDEGLNRWRDSGRADTRQSSCPDSYSLSDHWTRDGDPGKG